MAFVVEYACGAVHGAIGRPEVVDDMPSSVHVMEVYADHALGVTFATFGQTIQIHC